MNEIDLLQIIIKLTVLIVAVLEKLPNRIPASISSLCMHCYPQYIWHIDSTSVYISLQEWGVTNKGTFRHMNLCLEARGNIVRLQYCSNDHIQKWELKNNNHIVHTSTQMCLSSRHSHNELILEICDAKSSNQQWFISQLFHFSVLLLLLIIFFV